jgi:hypothetical protein
LWNSGILKLFEACSGSCQQTHHAPFIRHQFAAALLISSPDQGPQYMSSSKGFLSILVSDDVRFLMQWHFDAIPTTQICVPILRPHMPALLDVPFGSLGFVTDAERCCVRLLCDMSTKLVSVSQTVFVRIPFSQQKKMVL